MLTIPTPETKRSKWKLALVIAAVVAALFFALTQALSSMGRAATGGALQLTVDRGVLTQRVTAYGRLQSSNSSTVIAEVSGTVDQIHVYPGETLAAEQAMITLRNPALLRAVDQAELAYLEAQASKNSTEAELYERQITLENELALLASEIAFAQEELDTKAFLLEEAIVAKLDYLRSETTLEQTRLKHQLQQRKLEAFAKSQAAELKAAEYRLQEAEKQLEMARHDVAQLTIRAQREGTLNELNTELEVGSSLERGQAVAQITDPSNLFADLLVAAKDATELLPGQVATIWIRDTAVTGSVLRVYPSAENNQVRLEVRITEQLPTSARANVNVSAEIVTQTLSDTLRLPVFEAVSRNHSTLELFVAEDDRYVRRTVQLGVLGENYVQVIAGLEAGDQVLTGVPEQYADQTQFNKEALADD